MVRSSFCGFLATTVLLFFQIYLSHAAEVVTRQNEMIPERTTGLLPTKNIVYHVVNVAMSNSSPLDKEKIKNIFAEETCRVLNAEGEQWQCSCDNESSLVVLSVEPKIGSLRSTKPSSEAREDMQVTVTVTNKRGLHTAPVLPESSITTAILTILKDGPSADIFQRSKLLVFDDLEASTSVGALAVKNRVELDAVTDPPTAQPTIVPYKASNNRNQFPKSFRSELPTAIGLVAACFGFFLLIALRSRVESMQRQMERRWAKFGG